MGKENKGMMIYSDLSDDVVERDTDLWWKDFIYILRSIFFDRVVCLYFFKMAHINLSIFENIFSEHTLNHPFLEIFFQKLKELSILFQFLKKYL